MKMMLCDDRSALIPVATAGSGYSIDAAYLIGPSSLLDALSALFESMWQRAVPVNRVPQEDGGEDLAAEDVDLMDSSSPATPTSGSRAAWAGTCVPSAGTCTS